MMIAVKSEIPTCSGGIGALAGDILRSSVDSKIPITTVTLASHKGYLWQKTRRMVNSD
jgi:starch phosphorylase